jgi:two-component system sensor histidine kinase RpfC
MSKIHENILLISRKAVNYAVVTAARMINLVMNTTQKEKARNLELEQALMRLVLVTAALVYGLVVISRGVFDADEMRPVVYFGYLYVFISAFSILHVYLVPHGSRWRHSVYMCLDIIVTSVVMHYFDSYGSPYFVFYLWLTVGNGFRYGYRELILCAALSLIGFLIVCMTTQYWREQHLLIITGVMLLSVVPLYVAVMLKRLQEAKLSAEVASREKSRFLANISHEIRTPLNAIVGFSSMLNKVDDMDEQRRMIVHINNASQSLMDLVEGVLDLSRIEAGQLRMQVSQVDIRALMLSIEGMFSLQTANNGVEYSTCISDDVPRVVMADMQRLRQVLVNLVGNAVKFTGDGRIQVSITAMDAGGQCPLLRFDIQDTGPGIPRDFQGKIFDRFKQADDSAQRQHGGTGLGTAIAKHLVELMDGKIGLESSPGKGSHFWFTLPLVTGTAGGQPVHTWTGTAVRGPELMPDMAGIRVLIVEDSAINRYVYQNMFQLFGVDVIFAETGAQALDLLAEEHFTLMILDMQMPGMSGVDVINRYKDATDAGDRVPIVVITGDATDEVRDECESLGVSDFLPKPVAVDKMRELLGRYMVLQGGVAAGA